MNQPYKEYYVESSFFLTDQNWEVQGKLNTCRNSKYSRSQIFWVVQSYFSIITKLIKISVKKKTNLSLLLALVPYIIQPHVNFSLKLFSEIINFIFKSENKLVFQKHVYTGLLKELTKNTSLKNSHKTLFSLANTR